MDAWQEKEVSRGELCQKPRSARGCRPLEEVNKRNIFSSYKSHVEVHENDKIVCACDQADSAQWMTQQSLTLRMRTSNFSHSFTFYNETFQKQTIKDTGKNRQQLVIDRFKQTNVCVDTFSCRNSPPFPNQNVINFYLRLVNVTRTHPRGLRHVFTRDANGRTCRLLRLSLIHIQMCIRDRCIILI